MYEKIEYYLKHHYRYFFVGVFVGYGVYVVWDFKTRPELYAMQSAPWSTSILVYGAFTVVVLLICFVIKAIIKYKQKKK